MSITFVLGGARSGKSAYAQAIAEASAARTGRAPVMIATAEALDKEMEARIATHRRQRGEAWRTVETPLNLPAAVRAQAPDDAVVVDCLTLWLSNLMFGGRDVEAATDELLMALGQTRAEVVVVSNEVGMSLVPENALARAFRDAAGRLNRRVAQQADHAVVMFCGLGVALKGTPPWVSPHLNASL
ncbi:MAG: bifunctional adenosylcobinamide kinase/adenosylcobinamide-phosphate guanylyltransferase [Steroidobacteraceae bacterium]